MPKSPSSKTGPARHQKWVVSWTASAQGPYPSGNPSAQPDQSFAFPDPNAGARDQTFRLIVRPDIWGRQARIRFTNVFGDRHVVFDGAYLGIQHGAATILKGTNQPILFGGRNRLSLAHGQSMWSDAIKIAQTFGESDLELVGRKLAVSFHITGESGPMTWHAKALTTSYVTAPCASSQGQREDEVTFLYSTASWFFIDALEMKVPADSFAIAAFGDSITDGTGSTMNGDDRWTDVLSRRLHSVYGNRIAVVNCGIGGNQIAGPTEYEPKTKPFAGGPSSSHRLERDVLELSGVSILIWLQGINDFSEDGGATLEMVQATMQQNVERLRAIKPAIRIFAATLTSALNSKSSGHGTKAQDKNRRDLSEYIQSSGLFDGVFDFDKVTLDCETGGLRQQFVPDSTIGGSGDFLHPNRAGYLAMANAIDLDALLGDLK